MHAVLHQSPHMQDDMHALHPQEYTLHTCIPLPPSQLRTCKHARARAHTHTHTHTQVEEALSEEELGHTGVGSMQTKLLELQEEIDVARGKLHMTQSRVEENLKRVSELREEAVSRGGGVGV